MRAPQVLATAVVAVVVSAAACGGGGAGRGGDGAVVTGRVVSLDGPRVCVSPDRGATRRCASTGGAADLDGVDVGECAELGARGPDRAAIRVVDESACAAGDVGG